MTCCALTAIAEKSIGLEHKSWQSVLVGLDAMSVSGEDRFVTVTDTIRTTGPVKLMLAEQRTCNAFRAGSIPVTGSKQVSLPGREGWPSRRAHNPKIVGSNPTSATNFYVIPSFKRDGFTQGHPCARPIGPDPGPFTLDCVGGPGCKVSFPSFTRTVAAALPARA